MPTAAFRVSVSNTAGCIFWYRGDTVKKRVFYTELSYLVGIAVIALSTALTAWGDFGISMVVAPAFVLHLKMSQVWPWFTFGVAEYVLQAFVLLLMMCLLRRIKISYFLSFLTAIFYGLVLDGGSKLLALLPAPGLWQRLTAYICGDLGICAGVALIFHTYLPPEVYEMNIPLLGICYGAQVIAHQLGGKISHARSDVSRDYGRKMTVLDPDCVLFLDFIPESVTWMSTGDFITEMPEASRSMPTP